jgi:serine/threonine-protein kinase
VPDLTGKDADRAEEKLRQLGFKVQLSAEHDDNVPEGDVLSQDPSSGTLFRGDTVRLVVSKGPVMVQVPDVRRMGIEEATRQMEAAGFQVRTEHSQLYVGLQYVVDTDPGGGTLAPRGSVVTLYLV